MKIMVDVGEDGRIVAPPGVRVKIQAEVVDSDPSEARDAERELQALWDRIAADADSVVLKPWPEGDPIVEKYRRKGLID